MIDREQTFKVKFDTAASCFGVKPERIVSLKLRETVSSSHDYRHLLDALGEEAELKPSVIEGNLQGQGYLLWQGKSKIIIVEHTTGLEILYIAGSSFPIVGSAGGGDPIFFCAFSLTPGVGEELKGGNYGTMH